MVDFAHAAQVLQGISAVCGNIHPVNVLLDGTPQQIQDAVRQCLDAGNATTLISGGCETPRDTPDENLRAVAQALRN